MFALGNRMGRLGQFDQVLATTPTQQLLANSNLFAPLVSSLVLVRGTGSPTFTRATTATVMGYQSTDNAGASLSLLTVASGEARFYGARRISQGVWSDTFADGTPIPSSTLLGYLSEGARTQYLGVTDTPATQTTGSLGTGTYTLWVVGAGNAAVAGATATITGAGTATEGTPVVFTVTVAGTVTVTKTGALTRFQLENGAFPSSYIPNAGAAGTSVVRNADVLTYQTTGNFSNTTGWIYAEVLPYNVAGANNQFIVATNGANRVVGYLLNGSGAYGSYDGTNGLTLVAGATSTSSVSKVATTWSGSSTQGARNGAVGSAGSYDGNWDFTDICIGNGNSSASAFFGTIRNVRSGQSDLFSGRLAAITA